MDIAYLFGKVLPDVDFQHLNESEIIKIEKKLQLSDKLNGYKYTNENKNIIALLSSFPSELNYIFNDHFLRDFLLQNHIEESEIRIEKIEVNTERIQECITTYFEESFKNSIQASLQKNDFQTIIKLKEYIEILPSEILYYIHELLENKIEDGTHAIASSQGLDNASSRVTCLTDIRFYETLNAFYIYSFEEKISDLITVASESFNSRKFPERKRFYSLLFYRMIHFKSTDDDLVEVIQNNHSIFKKDLDAEIPSDFFQKLKKSYWFWYFVFVIFATVLGDVCNDNDHEVKYKYYRSEENNNEDLFNNLDTLSVGIIQGKNRDYYIEKLEEDMIEKLKYIYVPDSLSSKFEDNPKQYLYVNNLSEKFIYLIIDRKKELGSSVAKIDENTSDSILFFSMEKFKILISSCNSNDSSFKLSGLNNSRAKVLAKTYALKGNFTPHQSLNIKEINDSIVLEWKPKLKIP